MQCLDQQNGSKGVKHKEGLYHIFLKSVVSKVTAAAKEEEKKKIKITIKGTAP